MIPCEYLPDVLYIIIHNSTFLKGALKIFFEHYTKTSIFQTIVKLINIYLVFKFQAILRSRGVKIGAQKVDVKIDFKEKLINICDSWAPKQGLKKWI